MDPLHDEAVDEERASEREALRRRQLGATYKAIGKALGVSEGKAHHMVRAAHQRAVDDAHEVARPPGKPGKRTPERGLTLLDRLALDLRRVYRVIDDHVDLVAGHGTDLVVRRRVAGIEDQFTGPWDRLAERVEAFEATKRRARRRGGAKKGLCRDVERGFADLLEIAGELNPVLGDEYQRQFARAVFGRDLAELAEILGLECPPATPLPDSKPGVPPGHDAAPPAIALDADARRRRNERIVTARVGGASVSDVARAEGITTRHVRRIMAEHKDGRYVASPRALEVMEETVGAMDRELREFDQRIWELGHESGDSRTRLGLTAEWTSQVERHVSVLRNGGWLSPESVAQARKDAPLVDELREQFAATTNERLRAVLEEHGTDPTLIELVVDQVMIGAGLEDWGLEGGEDNIQA
jgi:hypothetical protein